MERENSIQCISSSFRSKFWSSNQDTTTTAMNQSEKGQVLREMARMHIKKQSQDKEEEEDDNCEDKGLF